MVEHFNEPFYEPRLLRQGFPFLQGGRCVSRYFGHVGIANRIQDTFVPASGLKQMHRRGIEEAVLREYATSQT